MLRTSLERARMSGFDPKPTMSSSSLVTSAVDRSRKSVFTRIAQAGDCGPQASREPSPSALDARTLFPNVGAAVFAKPLNLSELSKRN